ncbi:MAG: hypothetical protein HYX78_12380 [Armatimonadetes bacterium]|nr:hypothetical protein [Armatimonadota bacterium]
MKTCLCSLVAAAFAVAVSSTGVVATPSTTYWTPCTIDIQPRGLTHITYDTYARLGSPSDDPVAQFPADYGLTWGVTFRSRLAAEYGIDYLSPADDPLFFNAKIGYPEGALSKNAPAVQLGFFNFGTKSDVTNQNVIHLIVGKSLPNGAGRLAASFYVGNKDVLKSSAGEKENTGFMIAYDRVLVPDKFIFAADYASGDNAIGAGGFGLYYLFAKNASILVGPVWFNDKDINGKMKWTAQLDVNF